MYIFRIFFFSSFFFLLVNFIGTAPLAFAQTDLPAESICSRQGEITEKELKSSLKVMRQIIAKKGGMGSVEEQKLISSQGLDTQRLNCVLMKIIAANDAFSLGDADKYAIPLTGAEKKMAAKYPSDARRIKKYMIDILNITVE